MIVYWPWHEPVHDKIYNKTCDQQILRSDCTDQSSMMPYAFYSLRDIQRGINENSCHTGWMYRLIWVWYWSHRSYYRFCHALAHIILNIWTPLLLTSLVLKLEKKSFHYLLKCLELLDEKEQWNLVIYYNLQHLTKSYTVGYTCLSKQFK